MKREKTRHEGVCFRLQKKIGATVTGKAHYIVCRTGGKGSNQTEEKVGRESEEI